MTIISFNQRKTTLSIAEFVAKIMQNPALKEQFATFTSAKQAANKVVEIAEEHGLFFTEVEVLQWFDSEEIRVLKMAPELGENEVEETAGRIITACNTTRSRCGMCSLWKL